jgi:hypothetical protein
LNPEIIAVVICFLLADVVNAFSYYNAEHQPLSFNVLCIEMHKTHQHGATWKTMRAQMAYRLSLRAEMAILRQIT